MIQLIGNVQYQTEGSAGADLSCSTDILIGPNSAAFVPTKVFILEPKPSMYYLDLRIRSSLPMKKNVMLANGAGVIDSDYPGEILVPLYNFSDKDVVIRAGDRVAQVILKSYERISNIKIVDETRVGGFGSTGGYQK